MPRRHRPHMVIASVEHKFCSACDDWHPLSAFGNCKKAWDGLTNICRESANRNGRERAARCRAAGDGLKSKIPAGTRWVRCAAIRGKRVSCKLYHCWSDMRRRCNSPHNSNYYRYGALGIKVCDEWNDYAVFRAWAIANGFRKGLTIDREDSTGDYCPDNCRWADRETQTYNSSQTAQITFRGKTLPSPIWAKRLGLHPTVLRGRINAGWSIEDALTVPKGECRPGVKKGPGQRAQQ